MLLHTALLKRCAVCCYTVRCLSAALLAWFLTDACSWRRAAVRTRCLVREHCVWRCQAQCKHVSLEIFRCCTWTSSVCVIRRLVVVALAPQLCYVLVVALS